MQQDTIYIQRISGELPESFDKLIEVSREEGIANMEMLRNEWQSGFERFERNNAALFGAYERSNLIAIGGTTKEQGLNKNAMRMRRFYVLPMHRHCGIAKSIATACMEHGLKFATVLTCNAQASLAAGPFWEKMEFVAVDMPNITHIFRSNR